MSEELPGLTLEGRVRMTSDADIAAVYKLAFDEALRSIGDQRHTLETVRARGGILLSAASVVTSFLGGQALADGDLGVAGWLAIASFGGVGLFALAMLLLKGRLSFHVSPTQLIVGYIEGESTPHLPTSIGISRSTSRTV